MLDLILSHLVFCILQRIICLILFVHRIFGISDARCHFVANVALQSKFLCGCVTGPNPKRYSLEATRNYIFQLRLFHDKISITNPQGVLDC